ncbi:MULTISPECIES: hypothetical protein [Sinorhizobium]|uniref:hypothetical protein n=1 Tax=Sinorhizobium TaxID=28105 RepID=UPI000B4A21F4|nr:MULTISPECIES: hypothetical protein [Sinorhizobium]ASP65442.1 hypothetical protein CDO29_13095 [Sinorhizobium meliloti]MBO1964669.1 hypothetical protein [Sinorhizobium medicae]MDE3823980.1 hypothetical protein [Sinorhizobium meliloti]MDX0462714.1 hypothetical protein [Sinorhizobium medicae]MDX0605461.1 hypothetical protein [Sinorhizobium medicae]
MDHFTPFTDAAPPQVTIRDTPIWTYRAVLVVFAVTCMSIGWLGHGVTDALVDLDRRIASADRR